MAGHEADKVVAGNPVNLPQQVREIHGTVQILAVGVDVLPQQGNLLEAALHQLPDLGQDALRFPAALPAPDVGDDAVGTEVVAPVHDGDPCLHGALPHHGHPLGDGPVLVPDGEHPVPAGTDLIQQLREFPQRLGAENQVHMAVRGFDLFRHRLLLGHAAAETDGQAGIFFFGVDELSHNAEDFFFGVFPDGAGVDDDDIRPAGVLGEAAAHLLEHPHDPLAVGYVLLAAIGVHHRKGRMAQLLKKRGEALGIVPLAVHIAGGNDDFSSVHRGFSS